MRADSIIVMPGSGWLDSPALNTVAGEFGWTVEMTADLREMPRRRHITGPLPYSFTDALGCAWLDAVQLLRL